MPMAPATSGVRFITEGEKIGADTARYLIPADMRGDYLKREPPLKSHYRGAARRSWRNHQRTTETVRLLIRRVQTVTRESLEHRIVCLARTPRSAALSSDRCSSSGIVTTLLLLHTAICAAGRSARDSNREA
jgi:hypothetical protein